MYYLPTNLIEDRFKSGSFLFTVYSVSQLCYGQSSALNRYFVQLIYDQYLETGKIQSALASPCQPKGMGNYEIQGQKLLSTCTR